MTNVPPGWTPTTLGELGIYLNGRGFKKTEWSAHGRPIIRIQNLTGSTQVVNRYAGELDERHLVRPGDLLVSWAATLGAYIWAGEEGALNQHIFKVESRINRKFHKYLLDHKLSELMRQTHGSGMVHITRSKFDSVPVAVPEEPEQQRIVEILEDHLSRLDAANDYLDAASRRLDSIEQVTLERLTSVGEVRPLAELAQVQGGIQKQAKRRPVRNTYPFLRVANVTSVGLDLTDVHEIELFDGELGRYRLVEGDLLVVEGNGSPSQIGRAATWDGSIRDCVHQNHLIRVRPGAGLLPEYLESAWNAAGNRRALTAVASSTSGLYTLSVAKLQRLSLRVPPLEDQARVVAEVRAIRSARSALAHALAVGRQRSESLRRSLLAAAFSGRLTGRSSDLDVAEEMAFT